LYLTDGSSVQQVTNIQGDGVTDAITLPSVVGSNLAFSAKNSNGFTKLFIADGTSVSQVSNIRGDNDDDWVSPLIAIGDKLLFNARNTDVRNKIYELDATSNTVTQIYNAIDDTTASGALFSVVRWGDNYYATAAANAANDNRLLKYDG